MRNTLAAGLLALFAAATPARAAGLDYPIDRKASTDARAIFTRVLAVMERECPGWFKDIEWKGIKPWPFTPVTHSTWQFGIGELRPDSWTAGNPAWSLFGWKAAISITVVPPRGPFFSFLIGAGEKTGIASHTANDFGFWTCRLDQVHGPYTFREVPALGFLSALK